MSGNNALTEHESKKLLSSYGLPITRETIVHSVEEAIEQSKLLGFPVVLKLNGNEYLHKTELDGVKLNLGDETAVKNAVLELSQRFDKPIPLLLSEQVGSSREFIAGVTRNKDYGLTIAFGVGGIFAEIVGDVVFRLLPATKSEIATMYDDLDHRALLAPFRGEPQTDLDALTHALLAIGQCALDRDDILSIDVNPILISEGKPIAVDALVVLHD